MNALEIKLEVYNDFAQSIAKDLGISIDNCEDWHSLLWEINIEVLKIKDKIKELGNEKKEFLQSIKKFLNEVEV